MRHTIKDETFVNIKESGCNLCYVPKENMNIQITEDNIDFIEKLYNKLGQLEDIEEELGIDLITLLKALKNGIKCNDGDTWLGSELHISFEKKALFFEHYDEDAIDYIIYFYFKDYSKTWALTKEELQ